MGWIILGMVLVAVLFFLIIWFILAKNNLFFTFVEEGTAKAVMKAGAFDRIIFRWKKHFIDEEDNIHEEEDWEILPEGKRKGKEKTEYKEKTVTEQKVKGKIFGGLFWIGIWPIYTIHKYGLRWTDFRQAEEVGKEVFRLQFHEEKDRDFVMLRPAVYGIEVKDVETRPPERIRVTAKIPITMRVINPRAFLFIAPPTPLEDALVRISTLMRQRISMSTIDGLIALQGQAEKIWEGWEIKEEELKKILGDRVLGIKEEKLIKETYPKWGLNVATKGIEIKSIELPADIQKAMEEKRRQEMWSEGRAAEIMGSIVNSEAVARGKKKEEIQEEINEDLSRRKDVWNTSKELIVKKLAMENASYVQIEPVGVSGIDQSILSFIAAKDRMPMGRPVKERELAEIKPPTQTEKSEYHQRILEEERRKTKEKLRKKK